MMVANGMRREGKNRWRRGGLILVETRKKLGEALEVILYDHSANDHVKIYRM